VELFDFFTAYKRRNPSDLALVVVGDPVEPMPPHPDIFITGFVAEPTKRAAMAGSLALVQPSYFESFSLVLVEAWALGKQPWSRVVATCSTATPAAAAVASRTGASPSSRRRSIWFARTRAWPGPSAGAGRRYVERRYAWDRVIARYEAFLNRIDAPAPAVRLVRP